MQDAQSPDDRCASRTYVDRGSTNSTGGNPNGNRRLDTPSATSSAGRTRESVITNIADRASYWLISAGIYLTFGLLFFYSAKEKLIDNSGTMPAGLAKSFHGTFVASFPGTNTSWVLIGLLEALVFVVIAASVSDR